MDSTFFTVVAVMAILVQSFLLFLFFFEPSLPYKLWKPPVSGFSPNSSVCWRLCWGFAHTALKVLKFLPTGIPFTLANLMPFKEPKKASILRPISFKRAS